jgi:hypothetical protein
MTLPDVVFSVAALAFTALIIAVDRAVAWLANR